MQQEKNPVQLNVLIPKHLKKDLELHSVKTNIAIKEIVERAIADYLAWNEQI